MTSSYERPDREALGKLEPVARRLIEELSAWRKRCRRAESDLAELKARGGTLGGPDALQVRQRIVDLEKENHELRRRMTTAREQLLELRSRFVFLETRDGAV